MTITTQLLIISLGCILTFFVLSAAIQKKILERHALLWLLPSIFIILGGIFPQITYWIADFFHAQYPPSIIFAFAIIMLFLILFKCFQTLSVLTMKTQELAMQVSLLNQENEQLRKKMEEK